MTRCEVCHCLHTVDDDFTCGQCGRLNEFVPTIEQRVNVLTDGLVRVSNILDKNYNDISPDLIDEIEKCVASWEKDLRLE